LTGSVDVAEPPDFEEFVVQNQTLVDRDPYRDRLLYPDDDDIEVLSLPKRCRTVTHIVPEIGYVMLCHNDKITHVHVYMFAT
jgi:hypothetical protein